jgi:hypothetical protein
MQICFGQSDGKAGDVTGNTVNSNYRENFGYCILYIVG